jgi:amidohydrolase
LVTLEQLRAEADGLRERTVAVRRDLHAHPELGFQETRTAGIAARRLTELGYEVRAGVGRTGVVGLLDGAAGGRTLLLRFDMDALPIQELNDALPYRSVVDGVMHACGHDAHTAIGLSVAELLARHRAEWAGTVKLVFQPAEETVQGARAMIADGALESPRPDRALSLHVYSTLPTGTIALADGPMMAASDSFKVVVTGRGTHGAEPHRGADPIVGMAHMIGALQTIVSRNVGPLEQAVVSVGYARAGTTFNVIPDQAEFGGTIRSFSPAVEQLLRDRLGEIVASTAAALRLQGRIEFGPNRTPPLVNDPAVAEVVRGVARRLAGPGRVDAQFRLMGAEDAAFFLEAVPGAFVFVGAGNPAAGIVEPHHSPRFQIDEDALPLATALLAASALELLGGDAR